MASDCKRTTAVPAARFVGDPVDVVTGAVVGVDREFQLPGPFELLWRRYYDSTRYREDAGCGLGFRFEYDRRLIQDLDGLRYVLPNGSERHFPALDHDGGGWVGDGFHVLRLSEQRYRLTSGDRIAMEFAFGDVTRPAKLQRLASSDHAVSFGYNERGQLVTVADALGRVLRVQWSSHGRMQRVLLTDPAHDLSDKQAAAYEYDDAGRLVRATDPYGHQLGYAYDKAGRLARFTDRNGYSFHYEYDTQGRCTHTRADDGVEEARFEYDADARMTRVRRGNGGEWQYFHDDALALTQVIAPDGGVTEYQYDDDGKLVREIDPNKQLTSYQYDELGSSPIKALPTGEGVSPGAELDPFDAYGRRYRVARAPVTWHRPHGWSPATPAQWECGDLLEEPYALPLADTRPRFVTGDELATLVTSDQPGGGLIRDVRDSFGLLVREERGDGRARQYHYDPNGNPSRVTDFDGGRSRYQLSSWNHLVASSGPLDQPTSYDYDSDENLTALTDAAGNRSAFRYGLTRNLTEVRRNGRVRERFSHDLAGNVSERLGADGAVQLRFAYGDANLLVSRELASGDKQSFEYGKLGALAACSSGAGAVTVTPTIDGGYLTCDLRDGKGVKHTLTWGHVDVTSVLERFQLQYYEFAGGSTQMVVAPGERVHRFRLCGSGVVRKELADGSRETVQYDPQGRVLARLRRSKSGQAHDTLYRYSGEGDLLQAIDSERGLTRYEYDSAHRLIAVHSAGRSAAEEYGYDAAGNLVRKPGLTYFGDRLDAAQPPAGDAPPSPADDHGIWLQAGNRLYRVHGDYFAYDERDHLSERRGVDGITRYRYDELDQLIAIERPDGQVWRAQYDALGRRTLKQLADDRWVYYWNGDRLAAEILPGGELRVYLYADRERALVPFGFVEFASADADPATGQHYVLHANHQGSIERVVDEAGNVVWEAELEPFGTARVVTGHDFHQPLRFPGHYCDAETGLHYNRHRYYSPELGRYLQSDPADIEGGHNLYAYAQDGNPLRDVDLFGLACAKSKAIEKEARKQGLIDRRGKPLKSLDAMSDHELQLFTVARAHQLSMKMGPRARGATTVCVAVVRGADGKRKVIVAASTNNGMPPRSVQKATRKRASKNPDSPPEECRPSDPRLKSQHNGEDPPGLAERKAQQKKEGKEPSRDGLVFTETDGGAEPYQKQNQNHPPPEGRSEHHAEQRTQNSLQPGETIDAMGPSRPCCAGCNKALTNSGNIDKVEPSMQSRDAPPATFDP